MQNNYVKISKKKCRCAATIYVMYFVTESHILTDNFHPKLHYQILWQKFYFFKIENLQFTNCHVYKSCEFAKKTIYISIYIHIKNIYMYVSIYIHIIENIHRSLYISLLIYSFYLHFTYCNLWKKHVCTYIEFTWNIFFICFATFYLYNIYIILFVYVYR